METWLRQAQSIDIGGVIIKLSRKNRLTFTKHDSKNA